MKRCPECRRNYHDDTLLYCLDDGSALLEGPAGESVDAEPATAILPETDAPSEAATRAQVHTTEPTAVLPSGKLPVAGRTGSTNKLGLAAAGLLIVGVVAGGWYFFGDRFFPKPMPFAKIGSEELFTGNSILYHVISPDGKLVAYFKRGIEEGKDVKAVVVRQLGSGAENVIHEVDAENFNLRIESFSPDGEYIYFSVSQVGGNSSLNRIATLGGSVQKVLDGVTAVSISTDGKKIAFKKPGANSDVFQANIDGSGEEVVLALADINAGGAVLGGWSPDSKKLSMWFWRADMRDESGANNSPYFIAALDTADLKVPAKDRVTVLYEGQWGNDPRTFHWTPDGNGLIFPAYRADSPQKADIFHLSYPGGELRQITDDAVDYVDVEVAADGKSLVARTEITLTSLWSLDPETKLSKRLNSEDKAIEPRSLSSSNDGRLFFLKRGRGADDFYSMDQDGSSQKKLSSRKGTVSEFQVTPDGSYFVLSAWPPSAPGTHLYRMDVDGSNETQLTDVKDTSSAGAHTTGNGFVWFFRALRLGGSPRIVLMRMSVEGGTAEEIKGLEPSLRDYDPEPSPDERYLAYMSDVRNEQTGKTDFLFRVVELTDGVAGKKVLEIDGNRITGTRWTPDSKAIVFERSIGNRDLFKLDIATKQETQISDFDANMETGDFLWSQDGTKVLLFRSSRLSSLVRIKDVTGKDQ